MKRNLKPLLKYASVLAVVVSATATSGCSKAAFDATAAQDSQRAPGTYTVPAKVDFVLVEDDTGSMDEAYPQIDGAMPAFLSGLQNSGWDYHFMAMPLTTYRSINQIVASQYDSNWGSAWIPPFPGATPGGPGTIPSFLFSTPNNYAGFVSLSQINNSLDGKEPGFANITQTLYNATAGTNLLRPDAMLVILDVGNGNDTSNVNSCTRSDGLTVPCEQLSGIPVCSSWNETGSCQSAALSLDHYRQELQGLKPNGLVKYYAAVAAESMSNCQGGGSYVGTRYMEMASLTGGQSFDICQGGSNAISTILSELSSSLTTVQENFVTEYLIISQAPDVATIVVTRNDGTIIPEDPNNGWTYVGQTSGYMIISPVNMNAFTNQYAIKLNGSYLLQGQQSATVTYTPAGLKNSP